MSDHDDWPQRVDDAFDANSETTALRHEYVTESLARTLGDPVLVTGSDGVTRPTWTIEMPADELRRICDEHNARLGYVLDGGLTD
jgi:hypothetical protein